VDDDLATLRKDYPGWDFGSVWASAASGPDARRLWAARDGNWPATSGRKIRATREANDRRRQQ
jgi:hypothetical protein